MDQVNDIAKYIGYAVLVLNGLITVCLFIPGPEPEKFLQTIVDFLTKFSKK